MTTGFTKIAWRRDPDVPAGQPALGHFNCPCGNTIEDIPFGDPENHTCSQCGRIWDGRGWLVSEGIKEQVRQYLLGYAWLGTPEEREREVECILAQEGWQHIEALADKYASAQEEPGPEAFSDGMGFALSSLYECHTGPHTIDCPRKERDL